MENKKVQLNSILFDRIIQVTLHWSDMNNITGYKRTEDGESTVPTYSEYDITIGASELGGIKPDVSFTANLLPGDIFHEVTLTIKNLQLPYDIRRYKSMTILAGYRKQAIDEQQFDELVIRRFPIEIFYSYCLTPAPESVTVFKGIIVSSFTDNYLQTYFTTERTYDAYFFKNVTVIEYINNMVTLMNEAGYGISLSEKIPDYIKNILMNTGPDTEEDSTNFIGKHYQYKGIIDIVQSISSMLDSAYRSFGKKGTFNVNIIDNTLIIVCTDGFYTKDELVVELDGISEASLNAGILNVSAPWYPPLVPGDIIQVSRKYIDGSDLPNVINVDELMGKDNMYRILTMSISFSSVGSANRMNITAIPLVYAEENRSDIIKAGEKEYKTKFEAVLSASDKTLDEFKKEQKKRQSKDETVKKEKKDSEKQVNFTIHVGEVKEEDNPVYQYVNSHMSFFKGILDNCKIIGPMMHEMKESALCKKYYENFPKLTLPRDSYQLVFGYNPDFFDYIPGYDNYWLWPLLYALNYAAYKTYTDRSDDFEPLFYTSDVIKAGKYSVVPNITSWENLAGADYSGLYNAAAELKTVLGKKKKGMLKNIAALLRVL